MCARYITEKIYDIQDISVHLLGISYSILTTKRINTYDIQDPRLYDLRRVPIKGIIVEY